MLWEAARLPWVKSKAAPARCLTSSQSPTATASPTGAALGLADYHSRSKAGAVPMWFLRSTRKIVVRRMPL